MNLERELMEYLTTKSITNRYRFVVDLYELVKKYPSRQFTDWISAFSVYITDNFIICASVLIISIIYKNKRCVISTYANVIYYSVMEDDTIEQLRHNFDNDVEKFIINMISVSLLDRTNLSIDWLFINNHAKSARAII